LCGYSLEQVAAAVKSRKSRARASGTITEISTVPRRFISADRTSPPSLDREGPHERAAGELRDLEREQLSSWALRFVGLEDA
jgi:hypothetical protein